MFQLRCPVGWGTPFGGALTGGQDLDVCFASSFACHEPAVVVYQFFLSFCSGWTTSTTLVVVNYHQRKPRGRMIRRPPEFLLAPAMRVTEDGKTVSGHCIEADRVILVGIGEGKNHSTSAAPQSLPGERKRLPATRALGLYGVFLVRKILLVTSERHRVPRGNEAGFRPFGL